MPKDANRLKNIASFAWAATADHAIQRVEVHIRDSVLRVGSTGPLPTVLAGGGTDALREIVVVQSGDPWLAPASKCSPSTDPTRARPHATACTSPPAAGVGAGEAMDGWLRARAEVHDERLVSAGTSFGSHWMTPVAPTQPVFRGCSLALPVFEPDARTIFEQTPSTFKVRHMWMAGPYRDEDAFGRPVTG